MDKKRQGLIIVNTGNGKGKTTAAIGLAFRAAGHNFKILMIQFIKGSWSYGELESAKKIQSNFQIIPMGKGFIRHDKKGPTEEDKQAVREAWEVCKKKMKSNEFDMIVLDEINYVIDYNLLETMREKPVDLHVVMTGRNVRPEIIEIADLVTEMKEIKHPFEKGIKAQKGIEF